MISRVNRLGMVTLAAALLITGCGGSGSSPTADKTSRVSPTPSNPPTPSTPPTSSAARANIKVYDDCRTPRLQPAQIVLACADHGELFVNLHWTVWAADQATATGTFRYNDCTPDCAEGHFHNVPNVHVTLFAAVRGPGGQLVWSRLRMRPTVGSFPSVQSLPVRPD